MTPSTKSARPIARPSNASWWQATSTSRRPSATQSISNNTYPSPKIAEIDTQGA